MLKKMGAEVETTASDVRVQFSAQYVGALQTLLGALDLNEVAAVIARLEDLYRRGGQLLLAGNGGSAATAAHMACDLGKSIVPPALGEDGRGFRVLSLADNVAWVTAIANDYNYDLIFSEQVKTMLRPGDCLLAISASGNSPNVIQAAEAAHALGGQVIALVGFNGGRLKELADCAVWVRSDHYGLVEDAHMMIDHLITSYFRTHFTGWENTPKRG